MPQPSTPRIWASEQSIKWLLFTSCRVSSGGIPGDKMATLLESRDNVRQNDPSTGAPLSRTTIPTFHRKRSPVDV
jgi:hypothetical protein